MKRFVKILTIFSFLVFVASCSSTKLVSPVFMEQDISCFGMTSSGDCMVDAISYSKKIDGNGNDAKIHVLKMLFFEGIDGDTDNRINGILPLCPNAEIQHKEFFDTFFMQNGEYEKYIDFIPGYPVETTKMSSMYKIRYKLIVKLQELKRTLEKEGIIKSLKNIL